MGAREIEEAIEAAQRALEGGWKVSTARERYTVLSKMAAGMREHAEDLARIMTAESGKPLAEARGEVEYAALFYEFYAEEAKRADGEVIPGPAPGRMILTVREPVGVVGLVTPWNFPTAMITRKVGPALAAGCTAVIKPSEDTPLSALALCEIAQDAGLPKGVLNVVPVARESVVEAGLALCHSSTVRKISFTGSTPVGKWLARESADTVKRISLELGGNAPFIVFDDADLDRAATAFIASKFRNAGQTCVCSNRIFVQDAVYEAFLERVQGKIAALQVGHGLEDGTHVGPLINSKGLDKVREMVDDAIAQGAQAVVGGATVGDGSTNFFEPTLLRDATQDMRVYKEEIFGPVAPVFRFHEEAEVIAAANNTSAGLAAYVMTSDLSRTVRVAGALEYGMVAVNEGILSSELAPFGGVKESGVGREGSKHGLAEYQEIKYVCIGYDRNAPSA